MKKNKSANLDHYGAALDAFAIEYDIDLEIFGAGIHWRLTSGQATLDCWPTTGKYWIKDTPLNGFMEKHERTGQLPYEYNQLDAFLRGLLT